jgi:hypothetical protein
MPANRERQRMVREVVSAVRENMAGPIEDDALRAAYAQTNNLAEVLAVLAAQARAEGGDEATWAEVVLRAADISRETMVEAESVMSVLGYSKLAALLRRLARRAGSRGPTFYERFGRKARA